ncbi:unnamed protein product [Polarella glacialis]|uniref:tRNA (guanine(10)-N(2))-methyltransferase TRMT11 N-terminal domain-containing protein n=1 Tax=Polarella glacialis TaxID=89957 RepID=A0A813I4I1_POLGL|nr:unnamed protein product [Polarella glacialis]
MAACSGDNDGQAKEFLVLFVCHNSYFNMRFQELEALASGLLGVADPRRELYMEVPAPSTLSSSPLALVRLPGGEADARKLCERSVLIKAVLEVWSSGKSYEEAVEKARCKSARDQRRQFLAPPLTVQIRVEAFGRTRSAEEKRGVLDEVSSLFEGDELIDLRSPDTIIWALEENEHLVDSRVARGSEPDRVFICRQVAGGRSVDKKLKNGEKAFFHRYDLSQRAVLGPTTLDNELSFIMANCAWARPGCCGMDPFCGTGGLLVALSHFGVRLFGGEIDIRVVRGWQVAYVKNKEAVLQAAEARGLPTASKSAETKHHEARASGRVDAAENAVELSPICAGPLSLEYLRGVLGLPLAGLPLGAEVKLASAASADSSNNNTNNSKGQGSVKPERDSELNYAGGCNIFTNFVQYGKPMPDVVVCDNCMPPFRVVPGGWLDCIVTDPPYGVRASAKKVGQEFKSWTIGRACEVPPQGEQVASPSKESAEEDELSQNLLGFASKALRDDGRLVFLLPVDLADFLGIERAAATKGQKKDLRLCIPETTREPALLDEARYADFIPTHANLQLVDASLQVLSGGLGRLLVIMRRRPRDSRV